MMIIRATVILQVLALGSAFTPSTPSTGARIGLKGQDSHQPMFELRQSATSFQDVHTANSRHSASDYVYNVLSLPQSQILKEIKAPVIAVAGWSFVISVIHRILQSVSPSAALKMTVPGTGHSFLVSALGLLLVFRTNSAYQRFNEGRKIWENILSISRNFSRLVNLYSPEIGTARKQRILQAVAAFPYLLRNHIRPGCLCSAVDVDPEHRLQLTELMSGIGEARFEGEQKLQVVPLKPCDVDKRKMPWSLLPAKQLDRVAESHNRPLWVCDFLGRQIMQVAYGPNYTSRERLCLLGMIDKLTNAVGQCERIHQTAVPVNYARHSLRSLTLWLFTLPFALVRDMGLLTAPVAACIAWVLFGVYQIGYTIEDPFQGSLRLSNLCDSIRKDVLEKERFVSTDSTDDGVSVSMQDTIAYQPPLSKFHCEYDFLQSEPVLVKEHGTWKLVDAKK